MMKKIWLPKRDKEGFKKALEEIPRDITDKILAFHHQIREVGRLLEEWEEILAKCEESSFILQHNIIDDIQRRGVVRQFTPSRFNWYGKILVSMDVTIHYPPEQQELKNGITLILNPALYFQLMDEKFIATTQSACTVGGVMTTTKKTRKEKFIGLLPMGKKSKF
jgi:hypothetical protein